MSLMEHLSELRSRLLKCTAAVFVLGAVALVFARPIFGVLMRPVLDALPPDGRALVYTSGIEEINVLMKVGVYCGIFLTTPVILWQIWGFVSPGLYPEERRYASPFVVMGSLAFLLGAMFCYFAVLPSMFQFLLNEEESTAIAQRLEVGRLRADDALRFLRIGEAERAGKVALDASAGLKESGEGQLSDPSRQPSEKVELEARLTGLGALIDATAAGFPTPAARLAQRQAVEKRSEAVEAFVKEDYGTSARAMDDAAGLLAGSAPTRAEELGGLWRLEKELALGKARYVAEAWTRPMLTMDEQLSLVLLLILSFGIIFELPLVMALLGLLGIVRAGFLMKYQRHAFVVCLIAAAILTPTGDVVNLSLMAGPMLLCYEMGVLAVWFIERNRKSDPNIGITPTGA
ncbi:twin-arginine translocase subunit TatC [Archangium primigenium]|uniref:twin-arginine translocase subunit TatC n=1 Tax=[Archangium] primigenium TaxID=2792470 RepID=UPI00195DA542|nr:twin-arginine translocase subunit TatC [Archangium primigenium]MBM7113996.1 twin-arginine translocase subunit TatC [Archangium primigenium]